MQAFLKYKQEYESFLIFGMFHTEITDKHWIYQELLTNHVVYFNQSSLQDYIDLLNLLCKCELAKTRFEDGPKGVEVNYQNYIYKIHKSCYHELAGYILHLKKLVGIEINYGDVRIYNLDILRKIKHFYPVLYYINRQEKTSFEELVEAFQDEESIKAALAEQIKLNLIEEREGFYTTIDYCLSYDMGNKTWLNPKHSRLDPLSEIYRKHFPNSL